MTAPEQALCCQCGQIRTYKRARNTVPERMDSQTWHRMTGNLKCAACGTITRHALLRSDTARDYAEDYQRLALGGEPVDRLEDVDRARSEYRLGLPRNPYLQHRYWISEARTAWQDGSKIVTALCGERITLDCDPDSERCDQTNLTAPTEVRDDQEYEDSTTGLWWVEMDCVDCLRVSNAGRLKYQRKLLTAELLQVTGSIDNLDAVQIAELREHLGRLTDKAERS
ncbi:DUF6315 family protein [Mycobacterium sp. NPDC003323]